MIKIYNLFDAKKTIFYFFAIVFFSICNNVIAFEGGKYTIDQNEKASKENYLSFTALANDLQNLKRGDGGPENYSEGGDGVQGPIEIEVVKGSGPYEEQFLLTEIDGVNSKHTVTIYGNGNIIEYANKKFGESVIDLDGTDYFIFYDLEVVAKSQDETLGAKCFWIRNDANFNVIQNCNLRTTLMHTYTYGSAYVWIGNGTGYKGYLAYQNAGNDNLIDNCDMSSPGSKANDWGPYFGILLDGPNKRAEDATNRNTISNNNIQNFYYMGIFASYTSGLTILQNNIHNTGINYKQSTDKYGVELLYSDFIFESNKIYNLAGSVPFSVSQFPFRALNDRGEDFIFKLSEIKNNVIHTFGTGKTVVKNSVEWKSYYNGFYINVENNTISNSHPTEKSSDGNVYLFSGFGWTNFINNILHDDIEGNGGGERSLLTEDECSGYSKSIFYENNNFIFGNRTQKNGVFKLFYSRKNSSCNPDATFADMIKSGLPKSNISVNPNFINESGNSILIPTSIEMSNKGLSLKSVTNDILGIQRGNLPDIGAYEYDVDLEMVRLNLKLPNPICTGFSANIGGTLRNLSSIAIVNPVVQYILNGNTTVNYTVVGIVNPSDSINFTFPIPTSFTQSGSNDLTLKFLIADDNPSNDEVTMKFNVGVAPGGSVINFDNVLSSPFVNYSYQPAKDLTFPFESLVYDINAPSRVGYTNSNWDTDWTADVFATTTKGVKADSLLSIISPKSLTENMKVVFNGSKLWENDTFNIVIRILNKNGGCDTNFRRSVIMAPKAVPNFTTPNAICANSTFLFNNITTVSSGRVSVEWDFGDGNKSTDYSVAHTYPLVGNYLVTLKTTTIPHGFVTTFTKNVAIQETPISNFDVVNACHGNDVVFKNTSSFATVGTASYTWEFGDNTFVIVNNKNDYPKQYSAPGEYKVKLSTNLNGCISNITKTAFQFAKPVASFVKTSGDCLNDNFIFTNQSTLSQGQFGSEWFFDDLGNRSTNTNPTYKFASSGIKNVKLKAVSEFGCKDSMTRQITVKQTATTGFTFPFACSTTPTSFTNTTNLNGQVLSSNGYNWNFGDGTTSTAFAPIKSWSNIGTRVVTLTTNLANGCSSSETKTIVVGTQPNVKFFFKDQCVGSPVAFSNATTAPQGQLTYVWSFGDGNTSTLPVPTHLYNTTTAQTFTVKLKATVGSGCSDSLSKTINISPAPTSCDFDITGNINAGSSVPFTFTPKDGPLSGNTYTWLMGDGAIKTSVGAGTSYQYNAAGKYCITMTAKNSAGCECSKTNCLSVFTNINNAESMNNAVSIYPNPNSGVFNVTLDSEIDGVMVVSVFNTIGELISTIEVVENTAIVNLSDVSSGVYTIKVMTGNQIATKKITIVK
jgi:PKD repeat protein